MRRLNLLLLPLPLLLVLLSLGPWLAGRARYPMSLLLGLNRQYQERIWGEEDDEFGQATENTIQKTNSGDGKADYLDATLDSACPSTRLGQWGAFTPLQRKRIVAWALEERRPQTAGVAVGSPGLRIKTNPCPHATRCQQEPPPPIPSSPSRESHLERTDWLEPVPFECVSCVIIYKRRHVMLRIAFVVCCFL